MAYGSGRTAWPLDLVVVVFVAVAMLIVTFVPGLGLEGTPIHALLGFVFVFYVPGAAFASALFPGVGREGSMRHGFDWASTLEQGGTVTAIERLVLSLGLSVAIVPLMGLLLMFSPVGVWQDTAIPALSVLSLALATIGTVRRVRLPPEERFGVPLGGPTRPIGIVGSRRERLFDVVLVVGLVIGATGIGYAVLSPEPGERFTEFHLQTRDPESGELVADGYPSEIGPGEEATLYVGLTNQEHRTVSYTVVAKLDRVDVAGDSATVLESREIDRFEATVAHNESWRQEFTVTPVMDGEDLRLTFLLYQGEPPDEPGVENAYRSVHIWIDMG